MKTHSQIFADKKQLISRLTIALVVAASVPVPPEAEDLMRKKVFHSRKNNFWG